MLEDQVSITPKNKLLPDLTKLRHNLLDLTYKNRLLNTNYKASTLLRIIDENPVFLLQKLMTGKSLEIIAVPEPPSELLITETVKSEDDNVETAVERKKRPSIVPYAKS